MSKLLSEEFAMDTASWRAATWASAALGTLFRAASTAWGGPSGIGRGAGSGARPGAEWSNSGRC